MKKYLVIISIILIIILGIDATKRFSHANPDTTNHTLTIKQETKDNKAGEFTYRIKASKTTPEVREYWILEIIYNELAGDGIINGEYYTNVSTTGYTVDICKDCKLDGYAFSNSSLFYWGSIYYFDPNGQWHSDTGLFSFYYNNHYSFNFTKIDDYESIDNLIPSLFDVQNKDGRWLTNSKIEYNGKEYEVYSSYNSNYLSQGDYYFYIIADSNDFKDAKTCDYNGENCEYLNSDFYSTIIEEAKTIYLDLSSQLGQPVEENTYEFKLKNNETIDISIPDGYTYEIEQLTPEGWELVSINGSEEPIQLLGTMNDDITYTFLNKKTVDEEPEEPIVEPETPQEPEPTEPTPTNPIPSEPINPVKEEKVVTPKTENVVKRSTTPNTVDKIIIDVELLTISMLVIGIMLMLIKRTK